MRVVCISDTHCSWNLLDIPEADLLIHAGDIDLMYGSSQAYDFSIWLNRLEQVKHKIVVAGNHDFYSEERDEDLRDCLWDSGVIYLRNQLATIDGIKIWGSPITPTFGEWANMAHRGKEIREYWDKIPKDIDVLVTHGPPYEILDEVVRRSGEIENVGCQDLLEYVNSIKPKLHVFGHIHGSYGQKKIGNTLFVNASVMDEEYSVVNKPIIVEV